MNTWKSQIDISHPAWLGYRELLLRLSDDEFPTASDLSGLLLPGLHNSNSRAIRFLPAPELPGVAYEEHIFRTGEVSTREESWHDLFNALVWCRLPRLKTAMNAVHFRHLDEASGRGRGKIRDALTLLDESGVIVTGSNANVLEALAARDWDAAFIRRRAAWAEDTQILVCGHAILEKLLKPYKSMTAHALYLHSEEPLGFENLDGMLASSLLDGSLMASTAGLSPLPLMGIPGWWTGGPQDAEFYSDHGVFRPPRPAA